MRTYLHFSSVCPIFARVYPFVFWIYVCFVYTVISASFFNFLYTFIMSVNIYMLVSLTITSAIKSPTSLNVNVQCSVNIEQCGYCIFNCLSYHETILPKFLDFLLHHDACIFIYQITILSCQSLQISYHLTILSCQSLQISYHITILSCKRLQIFYHIMRLFCQSLLTGLISIYFPISNKLIFLS